MLLIIYLAFISLGLPDALLGSAWPVMHTQLEAGIAQGGFIATIISAGTIGSALTTSALEKRFGTGKITLFSVTLTALALFGFSTVTQYWQLIIWAIPYGLGAGCVDAALNAYVALHYEARHMNWLHCMWGVGASLGPLIMGWHIKHNSGWHNGYRSIAFLQLLLVLALALKLKSWKQIDNSQEQTTTTQRTQKHQQRFAAFMRPGFVWALIGFFCYCALESTCGLWAASYMVLEKGISPREAAFFASLFYIGITVGRAISGLLTLRLNGYQLQHLGEALIALGVLAMFVGPTTTLVGAGLVIIGLGCAPMYPQMIQLTPRRFGEDVAAELMGPQMAAAYIGSLSFPPLAGLLIENISPVFFLVLTASLVMFMTLALNNCDRLSAQAATDA